MTGARDTIQHDRVEVGVWPAAVAEDGEREDTIVVQVDTDEDTGRIRVNLNDAVLYDGVPGDLDTPEVELLKQTNTELLVLCRAVGTALHMVEAMQRRVLERTRELGVRL